MNQEQINQREWADDNNWTGDAKTMGIYFSHKDSRIVVPKRNPKTGWTLNLAKPAGVKWLLMALLVSPAILVMVALFICFGGFILAEDTEAPRVVSTYPENGSQNVEPWLKAIQVTFNEPMQADSWSWAYREKDKFPTMTGQPYYSKEYTLNTLPVKLQPNREYEVWINLDRFRNFKDTSGNPLQPFRLSFRTRSD